MQQRQIGDTKVSALGLGGMPMSIEGRPEASRSIATIHAALDAGITLIDTADAYHIGADEVGHNESLIARALATYGADTSDVLVATKGGHLRPGDGSWTLNGSPDHLRRACEASLRRLGVDAIGLYQFHRPDPTVPYEDSIGAIRDLLDTGKIQMAGISNADPEQIRTARPLLGGRLASVQNQFSPAFRTSEPELRLCDELGIAFLPLEPARWHQQRRRPRQQVPALRPSRRRARRDAAPGHPRLDAGHIPGGDPHPRIQQADDHQGFRRLRRPTPHPPTDQPARPSLSPSPTGGPP